MLQNIRMSNFVILKWWTFEYKTKFEKRSLLFISETFLRYSFKRLYEGSFENLQINSNGKSQTRTTMSHNFATL